VLKGSQKQFKAVLRTCVSEKMRCRCGSSDVVECVPIHGEFVFGQTSSTGGGKVFVVGGLRRSGGHGAKSVWMQICIRYCFWWCSWILVFLQLPRVCSSWHPCKGKRFRILVAGAAPEPVWFVCWSLFVVTCLKAASNNRLRASGHRFVAASYDCMNGCYKRSKRTEWGRRQQSKIFLVQILKHSLDVGQGFTQRCFIRPSAHLGPLWTRICFFRY